MTTPEPPVPPEAITLAAVALHDAECPDRTCSGPALGVYYDRAGRALKAAMPVIRADERQHLDAEIANLRAALREAGAEMDRRYQMGAQAEHDHIRRLAAERDARYGCGCGDGDWCYESSRPFADLIGGE